jgi:hypothetical protein
MEKGNELQKKQREMNMKNMATDTMGNFIQTKQVDINKLADLFLFSK